MAKQTTKYVAAVKKMKELGLSVSYGEIGDSIYPRLAEKQYAWEPDRGTWEKSNLPVNAQGAELRSMFMGNDGIANGTFRLRVMCHPDDTPKVAAFLKERLGASITDVSEKAYKNRKGPGERIYLTCELPKVSRGRPGLRRMIEEERRKSVAAEDDE